MTSIKVNETDVRDSFLESLNQNTITSTKEVKDKLRFKGFWVTESYVSSVISENYKNWDSLRSFNGKFYEYIKDSKPVKSDDDDVEVKNALDKPKKVKILGDVEKFYGDLILKIQDSDGNSFLIKGSYSPKSLKNPLYEVRTGTNLPPIIFIEGDNYEVLTRHRACYYAYLMLTKDAFNGIEYSSLRARKFKK